MKMHAANKNIGLYLGLAILSASIHFTCQFSTQFALGRAICIPRNEGACSLKQNIQFCFNLRPLLSSRTYYVKRKDFLTTKMMLFEDEDGKDFREADLTGKRLFVTGLASTVDDVRLYLAFEQINGLLEAHVVKPGIGYVVFSEIRWADEALDKMKDTLLNGKEIRVKRARSFYIRKEEEARMRQAQAQRAREAQGVALIKGNDKIFRKIEENTLDEQEGAKPRTSNRSVLDAKRHHDITVMDIRAGGVFRNDNPNQPSKGPLGRRKPPAPPAEGAAPPGGAATLDKALSDAEASSEVQQVLAAEEERIRRQAMIEIMKEGDKISKQGIKSIDPRNINMAT
uniref:RRM domain-containing protein n=1 Tax=Cryptomonas curvata TaxID=233186 RepID=A0A7S0QY70_9CRYP|mmetsp:Transcript_6960/g.15078  ORF Transcript_6960/g.15078 Transcript_6960/m.15078 type:complete len:341 (+) Transcript_6960:33-1055(+)